jgi:hypothetical protein
MVLLQTPSRDEHPEPEDQFVYGQTRSPQFNELFFLDLPDDDPGASYWNMGIGRNPGEVKNNAEGILTMETLGQNMAWLFKKIYS